MTKNPHLRALSSVDGRYAHLTAALNPYLSEFALIRYRVVVEIAWFKHLAHLPELTALPALDTAAHAFLDGIIENFSDEDAEQIKTIERTTNHDVKAVEYFLRQCFEKDHQLKRHTAFIHFALTSEDVNNVAYACMLKDSLAEVLGPSLQALCQQLAEFAQRTATLPMLSRTHGQAASPTTLGKELANVHARLGKILSTIHSTEILAKCNGAVGNFNAHVIAYPTIDWPKCSQQFITQLGLTYNPMTTQIEPHDALAEMLHHFTRVHTVLIDLCRDIWGYIAIGYFSQKIQAGEIGSSTMPHKVNPIDFENAEGNLGIANALLVHLAAKLPCSRWQRDLSDSTVLRTLGTAFGHALIAYQATQKGLAKLAVNEHRLSRDLHDHWEVLAEAVQTVMRCHGLVDAYEIIKQHTRGKKMDEASYKALVESLDLPSQVKETLLNLTPNRYTGLAELLSCGDTQA